MKTSAFVYLCCLITFWGYGQSTPTRIYLVKNGARTLAPLQFYTTLSADQPVKVKNNGYALIEMDADSLGIIKEVSYSDADYQSYTPKPKPVFIKFDKGKSYYFKIGYNPLSQYFDVQEMTERAFWLYVGLNELSRNVTKYGLNSSGSLVKRSQ